ncbi:hypothetical protein [Nocardia araoensis]|uniref:hypothetical protein n=1 Tax=Nocardia araoensis TaxID=228600 RepID=UPI0012F6B46F|nr:hypothetical protein [Nocardia araoensis]
MPMPPGMPMAPPANGARRTNGRGSHGNGHRTQDSGRGIFVRPFAGFGVPAEFDPRTGALRANPSEAATHNGVYGELGGVTVVFYRHDGRLVLRVGDHTVELDGPVGVEWGTVGWRTTRFAVAVGGAVLCELTYRSVPEEMDIGALIRAVVDDPVRRAEIFAG